MFNDPDSDAQQGSYAHALEKCAELAVWQLALAMRESDGAMERLGGAIERSSSALSELQVLQSRIAAIPGSEEVALDLAACVSRLTAQHASSVENLQFYDRMVQHLGHLKDYLAHVAGVMTVPGGGSVEAASLEQLNARFRRRLLTDAQRSVFDHVFRPGSHEDLAELPARAAHAKNPSDGAIEFF